MHSAFFNRLLTAGVEGWKPYDTVTVSAQLPISRAFVIYLGTKTHPYISFLSETFIPSIYNHSSIYPANKRKVNNPTYYKRAKWQTQLHLFSFIWSSFYIFFFSLQKGAVCDRISFRESAAVNVNHPHRLRLPWHSRVRPGADWAINLSNRVRRWRNSG